MIDAAEDAAKTVDEFIFKHRSGAIPHLVGACVLWAVENGGADVMKGTLSHAITLVDDMSGLRMEDAQ